jgi:hypothetical protein
MEAANFYKQCRPLCCVTTSERQYGAPSASQSGGDNHLCRRLNLARTLHRKCEDDIRRFFNVRLHAGMPLITVIRSEVRLICIGINVHDIGHI